MDAQWQISRRYRLAAACDTGHARARRNLPQPHYLYALPTMTVHSSLPYDILNLLDIPCKNDPAVHQYFADWQHLRDQKTN